MTDFVQSDIDFMGTFMCLVMRFTKASQRNTIMSAMKALQNDKMTPEQFTSFLRVFCGERKIEALLKVTRKMRVTTGRSAVTQA